MGGGAWPFLVRGLICLVNSVNERDLDLLVSVDGDSATKGRLLLTLFFFEKKKREIPALFKNFRKEFFVLIMKKSCFVFHGEIFFSK